MRKILYLILIILLFLSGCTISEKETNGAQKDVSVIIPDKETAESINGYYVPPKEEKIKYYANINTKKFHKKECIWLSKTDENNLKGFDNRNKLIEGGYSPCKSCKP